MKVLTFGTFDHLHAGHLAYLRFAEAKGELFIVVARDANVEHVKGSAPDHTETERLAALQAEFPTANIRLGDEIDYLKPIRDISPDLIVLGYDQRLPPHINEADFSCEIVRAEAFEPETYKSSLIRKQP